MSNVVWSINIMLAILLLAVCYVIYWVFKYDDWNPNPIINDHHSNGDDEQDAGMESRAEPNPS